MALTFSKEQSSYATLKLFFKYVWLEMRSLTKSQLRIYFTKQLKNIQYSSFDRKEFYGNIPQCILRTKQPKL